MKENNIDMGKQIRTFCAICQHKKGTSAGGCDEDISTCNEEDCALWFFRFGKSPEDLIEEVGEDARSFFLRTKVH